MPIATCTSFISLRTQILFRICFYWLGIRIYRRPWLFILIGVFITLCCLLGGLLFSIEVRNFYLWVPQESDIWNKFEHIKSEYGISPKMTLLLTMNDESESILSPKNMDIAYTIFNDINNIKLNQFNYTDLCLRPYPTSPYCTSDYSNIFGVFFGSNPLLWQSNTSIYGRINIGGANSVIYGFAGGIKLDDMQLVYSANVLLFIYELHGSINKTEHDIIYEYMGEFQDYWSIHKNDYSEINIEYATQRSLDDEVSRVIIGDFHIMVLAVTVMLIYLMLTLGPHTCSRPWLAISATLVLICSMAIGFGISFVFGTTFNIICILSAYILLGVGVDDIIILVDTYEQMKGKTEIRVAKTLSESGLSISLTSLCSSTAFFVGSTTDLPAISAFCTFAAWSFLANYILQFLIFVPLMVYQDQKKCCFACKFTCRREKKKPISPLSRVETRSLSEKETRPLSKKQRRSLSGKPMSKIEIRQLSGGNETPSLARQTTRQLSAKEAGALSGKETENKFAINYFVMKICVIPLLTKRVYRWIIIFLFTALFYSSIYVSFGIDTKFDDTKLVPDDSFMIDYIETYEQSFGDILITDLNIIIENQDFSDVNVRNKVYGFIDTVENDPNTIGEVHHWLNAFANFATISMNITHLNDLNDSKLFYQILQAFSNDKNYIQWHSEIFYNNFNDSDRYVTSTRFFLTAYKSADRSVQWEEYEHWNAICDEYFDSNNCYVFEPEYTFAYLVSSIQRITIENMIYAALGVFGILCIFLDFRMAVFCLFMVVIIDINLIGWMWLVSISLDVVSYTELVMAAGLTVDYVIHIVHAITEYEYLDDSYEEKIKIVMTEMGASVLKGGFTTLLGAIALVFSQSEAFRIFLFMFLGIIIIALAHSILLVPALCGEFKFIYKGIPNSNTIDKIFYAAVKHTIRASSTNGVMSPTMTNISTTMKTMNRSLMAYTMRSAHTLIRQTSDAQFDFKGFRQFTMRSYDRMITPFDEEFEDIDEFDEEEYL